MIESKEIMKKVPNRRRYKKVTKQKQVPDYIEIKKAKIRKRIDEEVGDVYDLLADTSKRLAMLERLTMFVLHDYLNNVPLSDERNSLYSYLVQQYIDSIESFTVKNRVDLENPEELFNKLAQRSNRIADIFIEENYLSEMKTN